MGVSRFHAVQFKFTLFESEVSDIGIIGSGVMGSNLGLNIADKSGLIRFVGSMAET